MVCPAARSSAPERKPKRTSTPTAIKPPKDAKLKAVRVNPGTVLAAGAPTENAQRQGDQQDAEQLLRAQRRPGADRQRHHAPAAGLRRRLGGTGQPNVNFGFTGHGKKRLRSGHQEDRPPRPGSAAAGRRQGSGTAALRGRARRPADHDAVDRLHAVPGRDRRLATAREISGGFTIASAQELAEELQSGALPIRLDPDLALAGLGDARQTGAQPGPGRRPRGLPRGVPVPDRLLPRARPDRGRRPGHLRHLLLRADQADPDHADAAGHRRPDPHDRRRGRRQHRDLRARQGGDPRRQIGRSPGSRPATNAASRRSSTPTSSRS